MIKKYAVGICLALLSTLAFAQDCERQHEDYGNYVQPWEFCDDDLSGRKLPKFDAYPSDKVTAFKPVLPKRHDGWDAEDTAAWMEEIQNAYKSGKNLFAGHYLFVQRGACGNGCHRAIIVDLLDGKVYVPAEIAMVFNTVNTLPETMCKTLDVDCYRTFAYRADSKLLFVVGQFGEEAKKRGLYHFQWVDNKLKLVSKIEKSPNEKRKKRAK